MCTSIGRRSAKPDDRISSSWIPIIETVGVVAHEVGDVVARLELKGLVRHAILRRAPGWIGSGVGHRPDALARVGVHDPAVVEIAVAPQLADGVDLDAGGPSDLESLSRRAVAVG